MQARLSQGEGLTLGLLWGCLALQLAGLQRPAELHADDVNFGLTVLQHLLGRQQQLPVLGAEVGRERIAEQLGSNHRPYCPHSAGLGDRVTECLCVPGCKGVMQPRGPESWLCHSCVASGKPLNLSGLVSSICRNGISTKSIDPNWAED